MSEDYVPPPDGKTIALCACLCHRSGYSVVHHEDPCCQWEGAKINPERDPVRPDGLRLKPVPQMATDAARKMRGWGPIPRNADGTAKL